MKRTLLWVLALCMLLLFAMTQNLFAGAPGLISYQGRLTNSSGDPGNGTFEMSFAIYPDSTGGTPVWSETHAAVNVEDGLFSVSLGSATSLTDDVFAASDRWLEITVGGESISPRTRLVAVPYARRVGTIEGAAAGAVSGVLEIGTSVKGSDLYESGLIIIGSSSDSVIISPGDDIVIRATTDDGYEAVNLNATVTGGDLRISSSDAAKAGTRHVTINPAEGVVIQGEDADGDVAVDVGMTEYGGNLKISSSDAAKRDPDVVTSEVSISPMNNIALEARDIGGDTLVKISTAESSGRIELLSNTAKATRRVQIKEDGIYFLDEAKADTNMIIYAGGSIAGKGQLSMGQENADLAVWANVLGYNNEASGDSSVVSGGYENVASGDVSTISGGMFNVASGVRSTVSGGWYNTAAGDMSTVGGGGFNEAIGNYSVIPGGRENYAGYQATVAGGYYNSARGDQSAVGGGELNRIIPESCTIGGGHSNQIDTLSTYSFIGGGADNSVYDSSSYAVIVGGDLNIADGEYAFLGGGYDNESVGRHSVLGGGLRNKAYGWFATLVGGEDNYCGSASFLGGGVNDTCNGSEATLVGGRDNRVSSANSAMCGGRENKIYGTNSWYNFIGCGYQNSMDGAQYSSVVGGWANHCSAKNSVILGGTYDTLGANAYYAAAFGLRVYLNSTNTVAFFDGTHYGKLGINRDDDDGGISYPIHVGTSASNGNGAYLSGGGTWTNGSSRTFKENFASLDGNDLLAKIADMQIDSWNYRNTDERHIGPVAEDFVAAFDVGATLENGSRDNKYLSTMDVAGVALAAVKELNERNQALESEVAELRALVKKLMQKR